MSRARVLVTGAGGFTGRYLLPLLEGLGYEVVGAGAIGTSANGLFACDLTRPAEVHELVQKVQPSHVVHLAALSFVGEDNAQGFYAVNLFGTLNLLNALAALAAPPRKVLIASSANVYGSPGLEIIDESVCPAPVNHYACSKLAMEHMSRTWCDRLPIVLTRPFNYTGVGQDERFLIPKIVSHFRRRRDRIELGNLEISRDFSDVRDVVSAYAAILGSAEAGKTFNVCSGRAVALREIIQTMEMLTGHRMRVEVNGDFVRANEIPVLRGSCSRLRAAVGFEPKYTLEQTLGWMYRAGES